MAADMVDCFRTNVIGPQLMMDYFVPLLRRSGGTPRIINVTSGAGSMQMRLKPSAPGAGIRAIPYQASKSALNMVTLQAFLDYDKEGIKVFMYCPGFTASNLGSHNKVERGAKPTAEGAGPMVPILNGERDADVGKYLNWNGEWPW
jgi:NAD(P)-dependent dehydrogenase (short-subunit alcohol dehydrogenase family)